MRPDAEQSRREAAERTREALTSTDTAVWELHLERRQVTWGANLDARLQPPIESLEERLPTSTSCLASATVSATPEPGATPIDASAEKPQVAVTKECTVLLIEDQEAVRALVRRILEREGFDVLEADESSGAERLFDAHRAEIALVLTDVGIPGETGPVLFRRLLKKKPELKVIYMSGEIQESALGDEPAVPHERFLAKPFTAARLIGVVRDALRH
jgi:CheY-like chemotaxis protein